MLSGRVQTHINSHELTFTHSLWHTNTQSSTPRFILPLTVTDALADKSPHASGRAWCWGPSPLLQTVPQNRYVHTTRTHIHTHLTYTLCEVSKAAHAHTPYIAVRKPLHPYKCRHFLSLLSLPLPASLLLLLAASQPIRREVTSCCCSQCGGRRMNACAWWERKGDTHRHPRNINRASLCHCQTS